MAQKEYKRQHNNKAKKVHWDLCKKNGQNTQKKDMNMSQKEQWKNEEVEVLWNIYVHCDNVIEARRPDIILIDKKERKGIIINIAVPAEVRGKEREKMEKYQDLKREIVRLQKLKMVEVVPVVIGALESVTKEFDEWIEKLGITNNVGVMQKTALLETARILRKVLEMLRRDHFASRWSFVMTPLTEEM